MNWVGEKFNSLPSGERYNRTLICSHIRTDLKNSFNPKLWKFGVAKDTSNGITIKLKRIPNFALNKGILNFTPYSWIDEVLKEEYVEKIKSICNAYNYDNSDGMTDYYDRNYYLHFEINNPEIIEK